MHTKPSRVLLDTNVYDRLAVDLSSRDRLCSSITCGRVTIIVSARIVSELAAGPLASVPDWLPVEHVVDSVFALGFGQLGGVRLGQGDVFRAHIGQSKQFSDAIIADTVSAEADVFVSDDKRCRTRVKRAIPLLHTMSFDEFSVWICSQGTDSW